MKSSLPLRIADIVAKEFKDTIAPNCRRIEVAGSVRRRKAQIGDIEIVALSTLNLYAQLDQMIVSGLALHTDPKRWGGKARSFRLGVGQVGNVLVDDYIQIDMFLQIDPATWGVNFLLRTGSADFSRRMVTKRSQGGFMPNYFRLEGARVKAGATVFDTPEEEDVFLLWGIDYVLPAQRTEDYWPKFGEPPHVDYEEASTSPSQASLF